MLVIEQPNKMELSFGLFCTLHDPARLSFALMHKPDKNVAMTVGQSCNDVGMILWGT